MPVSAASCWSGGPRRIDDGCTVATTNRMRRSLPANGPPRPTHPSWFLLGEQPGDQEDLQGHPFVGPAGRMLDKALAAAGINRDRTYVTNTVKHFRFSRKDGAARLGPSALAAGRTPIDRTGGADPPGRDRITIGDGP